MHAAAVILRIGCRIQRPARRYTCQSTAGEYKRDKK